MKYSNQLSFDESVLNISKAVLLVFLVSIIELIPCVSTIPT